MLSNSLLLLVALWQHDKVLEKYSFELHIKNLIYVQENNIAIYEWK